MEQILSELRDAEELYYEGKCELDLIKAKLWVNTDFVTVLDKAKPTETDKRKWIAVEVADMELENKLNYVNYQSLLRIYECKLNDKIDGGE